MVVKGAPGHHCRWQKVSLRLWVLFRPDRLTVAHVRYRLAGDYSISDGWPMIESLACWPPSLVARVSLKVKDHWIEITVQLMEWFSHNWHLICLSCRLHYVSYILSVNLHLNTGKGNSTRCAHLNANVRITRLRYAPCNVCKNLTWVICHLMTWL